MQPLPNEEASRTPKAIDGPPWSDVDEQNGSRRLAHALDNGGWLHPIAVEGAPLDHGEGAYADLQVHGWRYHALDVQYEHRTVMFGGPLLFAATGLASLTANRRRRHEAERFAAPQWRPLGPLRVVVTSGRLLVWHQGAWWPVWYSCLAGLRVWSERPSLDLYFESDPPYRLEGPGTASLSVLLERLTVEPSL